MPIDPSTDNLLPRRLREATLHHIALVGMPGAGKSTVAKLIGVALGLPVLDLDEEIASAARKSVAQLFTERGEVLFRAQERAVLRELLHSGTPSVIACGGGTWADATMRRDLSQKSVPICLTAPVETLLERLGDPEARRQRPLLGGPDPMAALRKLERERRAAYVQCILQLDTESKTPEDVAQAALALLEEPAPATPQWIEPQPKPHSAPQIAAEIETVIERGPSVDRGVGASPKEASHSVASQDDTDSNSAAFAEHPKKTDAIKPSSDLLVAGEADLPDAPQIPWWPASALEGAEEDSDDDGDLHATEAAQASFDEHFECDGDEDDGLNNASEPLATAAAPRPNALIEEHTPTLADVARSLAPFSSDIEPEKQPRAAASATPSPRTENGASEDGFEESWQPQMSAWAPLEDANDGVIEPTEPVQSSSAAAAQKPTPAQSAALPSSKSAEPICAGEPLMITAQGRAYPVHIAEQAGDGLALAVSEQAHHAKVAIICDTQINALFMEPLRAQLTELGLTVSTHTFVAGEEAKTLKTVYNLYDELSDAKLSRGDLIVGFGGGVTLDVAGFVASTYLRGVRLMMVPTSTLAAVDACVGGKNGVNTRRGKNLVGTIYPPHAVYIAMDYLATQSRRAHTAGLVEVLKMGALLDPDLFAEVASGALLKLAEPQAKQAMMGVLRRALTLKAQVVEEDEHERGRRAILNYGHTVGHALEIEMGNGLSHGEAVGLGMVAEAAWAEAQGLGDGVEAQLKQALKAMNMPVDWRRAKLSMDALAQDKKRRGANVQLPVLRALGDVTLHEIPLETLADYTHSPAPEA